MCICFSTYCGYVYKNIISYSADIVMQYEYTTYLFGD